MPGLLIVESTLIAYGERRHIREWKPGQLHRLMDVLVRENDELREADAAVYSDTALHALAYARAAGARVLIYTPAHETAARRFFLYQGFPLAQQPWKQLVERNPGAAYLTTVFLKRSAPLDVHPRFVRLPQLSLTPRHVAEALDLLNIRRTT